MVTVSGPCYEGRELEEQIYLYACGSICLSACLPAKYISCSLLKHANFENNNFVYVKRCFNLFVKACFNIAPLLKEIFSRNFNLSSNIN